MGDLAHASRFHSAAVVGERVASATGAQAFGWQARATGNLSLAAGHHALANEVKVGYGATKSRANQVVLCSIASSTVAQRSATSAATVDASGTLGARPTMASLATASSLAATKANITTLQTLTAAQQTQINGLFGGLDKAYEGVAMGLAMESPSLPAGTNFGLSGAVGYYQNSTAGTLALSARVGENAAFSAGVGVGVGVGFDSGEVGARGGFQVAW